MSQSYCGLTKGFFSNTKPEDKHYEKVETTNGEMMYVQITTLPCGRRNYALYCKHEIATPEAKARADATQLDVTTQYIERHPDVVKQMLDIDKNELVSYPSGSSSSKPPMYYIKPKHRKKKGKAPKNKNFMGMTDQAAREMDALLSLPQVKAIRINDGEYKPRHV